MFFQAVAHPTPPQSTWDRATTARRLRKPTKPNNSTRCRRPAQKLRGGSSGTPHWRPAARTQCSSRAGRHPPILNARQLSLETLSSVCYAPTVRLLVQGSLAQILEVRSMNRAPRVGSDELAGLKSREAVHGERPRQTNEIMRALAWQNLLTRARARVWRSSASHSQSAPSSGDSR